MYQSHDEGTAGRSTVRPRYQDTGIDSTWLHDNVLQVLEYVATDGFGTGGDRSALRRLAAQAADDLRGAIDRPDTARAASGDLRELLADAVRRTDGLSSTAVELDLDELTDHVPGAIASAVAAGVGAALANVHRHASARVALVRCVTTPGHVVASVTDDGTGFDVGSTPEGVGLRSSLRARIARIGGRVMVASAPGSGTIVRIAVGREPQAEVVA